MTGLSIAVSPTLPLILLNSDHASERHIKPIRKHPRVYTGFFLLYRRARYASLNAQIETAPVWQLPRLQQSSNRQVKESANACLCLHLKIDRPANLDGMITWSLHLACGIKRPILERMHLQQSDVITGAMIRPKPNMRKNTENGGGKQWINSERTVTSAARQPWKILKERPPVVA